MKLRVSLNFFKGIMEPIFSCLLHPVLATRLTTAWCLRCATISVPSQLSPLIDRCINRLVKIIKNLELCIDGCFSRG